MQPDLIEMMRSEVSAIHHALAPDDAVEAQVEAARGSEPETEPPLEEVTRRFAELEAMARMIPEVAEHVPPFSFAPMVDALATDGEFVIMVAVPGVEQGDLTVECDGRVVTIAGVRRSEIAANGHRFHRAEIPHGPFYRAIAVPVPVERTPRLELERGLLRIRLGRSRDISAADETTTDREDREENGTHTDR